MLVNLLKPFTHDSFVWGGFTFLLGAAVVFLGMIVLVLAVSGMGIAMKKFDEHKKEKSKPMQIAVLKTNLKLKKSKEFKEKNYA